MKLRIRDGPIPIPNTRYYRYQRLEETYRILAGNIDYFDTAEPAIFLIVAIGLMIKMTVLFLNLFIYYFIIIYLSRRYKILNMLRNWSEKLLNLRKWVGQIFSERFYSVLFQCRDCKVFTLNGLLNFVLKISISVSILVKKVKYRVNIVSKEKAGIAHPYWEWILCTWRHMKYLVSLF